MNKLHKPIPNTTIHPSKKDIISIKYQIEYTEKDEYIKDDYSNLNQIKNILDLEELIKTMFILKQRGKYNINIGYSIEDNKQWIIEDFVSCTEDFKSNAKELKQSKQITEQQTEINELRQDLELYKSFIKKYKAEKQFNEFKEKGIFWYELLFRGISPGCQPKEFIDVDHTKGKYGIVAYNRKLTNEELKEYEMREYNY